MIDLGLVLERSRRSPFIIAFGMPRGHPRDWATPLLPIYPCLHALGTTIGVQSIHPAAPDRESLVWIDLINQSRLGCCCSLTYLDHGGLLPGSMGMNGFMDVALASHSDGTETWGILVVQSGSSRSKDLTVLCLFCFLFLHFSRNKAAQNTHLPTPPPLPQHPPSTLS